MSAKPAVVSQYKAFKSKLVLPMIDREGKVLDDFRTFENTPVTFIWPGELMVLIDWAAGAQGLPTVEELAKPIRIQRDVLPSECGVFIKKGTKFYGGYAWGSGAKKRVTIGMTRDLVKLGLGAGPLDGQRFAREELANCMYGAATTNGDGVIKVLILGEDELVPELGFPMADGFDYYDEDLIETAREACHLDQSNNPIAPQEPTDAKDTYARDQRVRLKKPVVLNGVEQWVSTGVWEESLPYMQAEITKLLDEGTAQSASNEQYWSEQARGEKAVLARLDPLMMKHAYLAFSLRRGKADRAQRLASSFVMRGQTRLMVPTTAPVAALPIGRYVMSGMPQTSYSSSRAIRVTKGTRSEVLRISRMPVVQTTIRSKQLFSKGQGGVIKGLKEATGYDIVMCSENIKMGAQEMGGKKGMRQRRTVDLTGAFIGLLAYTAPGHSIGISPKVAKEMSRDYDGDYMYIINCAARPAYWAEVNAFPDQKSPKLAKIAESWPVEEDRPRLILETMDDIIGFATNLMSATFTMMDHAEFARSIGYRGPEGLDEVVTWFCRIGEDLFKTDLSKLKHPKTGEGMTIAKVLEQMGQMQKSITGVLGKMPSYCGWKRSPYAFKQGVPVVWSHDLDGLDPKDHRVKTSINPGWTGTIATIAKFALPQLQAILEAPIEHLPLMEFQPWGVEQEGSLMRAATIFQNAFNTRVVSLNWGDRNSSSGTVSTFLVWLRMSVDQVLKETGATPWAMANALWFVAHGARSENAGAASVFMAFPEEAKRIVVEKPGLKEGLTRSLLLGLAAGVVSTKASGVIKSFTSTTKSGAIVRGFVPDNKALLKPGNLFAGIPANAAQLATGRVILSITQAHRASWNVEVLSRQ